MLPYLMHDSSSIYHYFVMMFFCSLFLNFLHVEYDKRPNAVIKGQVIYGCNIREVDYFARWIERKFCKLFICFCFL